MEHAILTITPRSRLGVTCWSTTDTAVWVRYHGPRTAYPVSDYCSVPMTETTIKTLYVFVEISIDSRHLHQSIRMNFPDDRQEFYDWLLRSEDLDKNIPAGTQLPKPRHLTAGSDSVGDPVSVTEPSDRPKRKLGFPRDELRFSALGSDSWYPRPPRKF